MCIGSIITTDSGVRFGTYRSDDGSVEMRISDVEGNKDTNITATIGESGRLVLGKWDEEGYRYGHITFGKITIGIRAMVKMSEAGNKYLMFHGPWQKGSGGKAVDSDL
jgi:hypothetical protein